ncbi:MAG: hypothetical protein L0221_15740 [Chloroflexi bacterium]|nr:hypothetical protein [Chloroflexota bacterium]
MADRPSGLHAAHDRHDLELVAGCPACDALAPDFAALSSSLASVRGGTDAGHRDFRLTASNAARLRRGRGMRAWLRPLAAPSFAFARPLGSALSIVALIGLVASSLPDGSPAGGLEHASVATQSRNAPTDPPPAAPAPSGDAAFDDATGAPDADASVRLTALPSIRAAAPTAAPEATAPTTTDVADEGTGTPNAIFLASLVLLPIGLLLVFGRGLARRLGGPSREP